MSKSVSRFAKSAHQEICWGEGICWQKYPNLLVRKSAGGICQQKYSNLPVSKSVGRITKSASQEICRGWNLLAEIPKSASQEICLGGICWQKYPNLPVLSKFSHKSGRQMITKVFHMKDQYNIHNNIDTLDN